MKEKIYNVIVSIICCVYAITTIVFLFVLPKYNLLFPGWWTLILIFPSLGNLLFQKNKVSSAFVLSSGILLLLASLGVIDFTKCFTILICFAIIIIGISIIKTTFNLGKQKSDTNKTLPLFYTVFGATEEIASRTLSEGGEVVAICGSTSIDMKDATFKNNSVIKTKSILGSVELILPSNVEVITNPKNYVGEALNYKKSKKSKTKVYVESFSILGSIKIK
jgi:predicted membrane protein